ncbi:hypothetical protein [Nitrobacter sp. JJSN]|uniref:hypothetical protein n=1 Tax=Nitrobacter sp. JJSN TaxID=3453033 RepID=UPI003F76C5C7
MVNRNHPIYSMTKSVDAIRRLFVALNSRVGNLPSLPGIFSDYPAPIVRNATDDREIVMARWGMPASQLALMESAEKRAAKVDAKGKPVDFVELLRNRQRDHEYPPHLEQDDDRTSFLALGNVSRSGRFFSCNEGESHGHGRNYRLLDRQR